MSSERSTVGSAPACFQMIVDKRGGVAGCRSGAEITQPRLSDSGANTSHVMARHFTFHDALLVTTPLRTLSQYTIITIPAGIATSTGTACSSCHRQPRPGEAAFLRCSGCRTEYYCSTQCQRKAWKRGHKQQCSIMKLANSALATAAMHTGETVVAVRLACNKESGGFWNVSVPANHTMFDSPLLEVPAIMGIPLVIHRVGTQSNNRADLDCRIATFLNVKYEDGFAPREWQSHVGTCIVARKDKKPLSAEHLEAVWMYIDRLMDIFGEEGPEKAQKEISRDSFEEWFEDYKNNEVENGRENWKNVGSIMGI